MKFFHVRCEQCGSNLKIQEEWIGRRGKCPKCETVMRYEAPQERSASNNDDFCHLAKEEPQEQSPVNPPPPSPAPSPPVSSSGLQATTYHGPRKLPASVKNTIYEKQASDVSFSLGSVFSLTAKVLLVNGGMMFLAYAFLSIVLELFQIYYSNVAGGLLLGDNVAGARGQQPEVNFQAMIAVGIYVILFFTFFFWVFVGFLRYTMAAVMTRRPSLMIILQTPPLEAIRPIAIAVLLVAVGIGLEELLRVIVSVSLVLVVGLDNAISIINNELVSLVIFFFSWLCTFSLFGLSFFRALDPFSNTGIFRSLQFQWITSMSNRLKFLVLNFFVFPILVPYTCVLASEDGEWIWLVKLVTAILLFINFLLLATAYTLLRGEPVLDKYYTRTAGNNTASFSIGSSGNVYLPVILKNSS